MSNISDVLTTIRVMTDVFSDKDIIIEFSRGLCATNGQKLWINAGDPNDSVWKDSVLAKVVHEAGGHISHTDFGLLNNRLRDKPSTFCSLLNIIEDVRIETKCMSVFSGAYSILQHMTFLLFKEGYWNSVSESTPPENLVFAWLLFGGRGRGVDGQDHLIVEGQNAREVLENIHGIQSPIFNKIEKRMEKWGHLASTQNAYDETVTVYALLKQLSQQDPQPEKSDESCDESGQSGDESGQSGESNDESGQSGASGGTKNVLQDGFEGLGDCYLDFDVMINQIINAIAKQHPMSDADFLIANVPEPLTGTCVPSLCTKQSSRLSRGVKRTIESQLWSKESQPITYDDSGVDFDDQLLGGVMAGNNRIFFHEEIVKSYKSSVMILLDVSGSMTAMSSEESSMYQTALIASLSIIQALEELDIDCAMMTFNNSVNIAKEWNQSLLQASEAMYITPSGGTGTDVAIRTAAAHFDLLDSEVERKQLIVITDGQPNNVQGVINACGELTGTGFDIASIQIMLQGFSGIENYRTIDDVEQLNDVLEEIVRDGLLSAIHILLL